MASLTKNVTSATAITIIMERTLTKTHPLERRFFERRRFRYSDHMPERREGHERRNEKPRTLRAGLKDRVVEMAAPQEDRKIARI